MKISRIISKINGRDILPIMIVYRDNIWAMNR